MKILSAYCYSLATATLLLCGSSAHGNHGDHHINAQAPMTHSSFPMDPLPASTREYWMRQAIAALSESAIGSPCQFAAFGTVIVNHTDPTSLGELVCIGANGNNQTGDPTLHGEIVAIQNCTKVLTDPDGAYKLSPAEALAAFKDLSLYTDAEACPMCASAIRWAGFKEYIYGTSVKTLTKSGWSQIQISSREVMARSFDLPGETLIVGDILANETDPLFLWQFNATYPCPKGCERGAEGSCEAA